MNVILFANKIPLLRQLTDALSGEEIELYITKSKNELLEYFDKHKDVTILIASNECVGADGFLTKLRKNYPYVKVCVISNEPNIKEANGFFKLNVKGYANAHMHPRHTREIVESLGSGRYWFYPKFIETFSPIKYTNHKKLQVGVVGEVKNIVLSRTNDEEKILSTGDEIYENETVVLPNESSKVEIKLITNEAICIQGEDKIFFEESVFRVISLEQRVMFDEDVANEIFGYLGGK